MCMKCGVDACEYCIELVGEGAPECLTLSDATLTLHQTGSMISFYVVTVPAISERGTLFR